MVSNRLRAVAAGEMSVYSGLAVFGSAIHSGTQNFSVSTSWRYGTQRLIQIRRRDVSELSAPSNAADVLPA